MSCKDCKNCEKDGLLILPLRYSVVVAGDVLDREKTTLAQNRDSKAGPVYKQNPAMESVPSLPEKIGQGVVDLKLSRQAKYGVRILREGYLYVLLERKGNKYWQAYLVLENGQLYLFDEENPPESVPPPMCNRDGTVMNAYMVGVKNAHEVPNAWFLFTATPLTKPKLDEYRDNVLTYTGLGRLQHFSPAKWLENSVEQPHTLLAPELHKCVIEYVLFNQCKGALDSPLGLTMQQQLFPAHSMAYAGTMPDKNGVYQGTLGRIYHSLRSRGGAAFVVHDHIGITQELNDFRNAALEPIQQFLNKTDQFGVDNQRKLEVSEGVRDLQRAFQEMHIANVDKTLEHEKEMSENFLRIRENHAAHCRAIGRIQEAEATERQIATARQRRAERVKAAQDKARTEAPKEWSNRYLKLLDEGEIEGFREALGALSKVCGDASNSRAPDHHLWIRSNHLVEAFETYDKHSLGSGIGFSHEFLLCSFGMFGVKSNQPTLEEWLNVSKVERANLYLRTAFYNQADLEKEAHSALSFARDEAVRAGGVDEVSGGQWLGAAKKLVDLMKKADSAWDEWLRDNTVKYLQSEKPEDVRKAKYDPKGDTAKLRATQPKVYEKFTKLSRYNKHAEGMMYAYLSEWTQALSNKSGRLDMAIQGGVGLLLYSKLGKLTEKISMEDLMLKFRTEAREKVRARKQKNAEYQARADEQKRNAPANVKKVEAAAKEYEKHAREKAQKVAAEVDTTISNLIRDEQEKVRNKVKLALDELSDPEVRPETNNFRQARLGVLLLSMEMLALSIKYKKWDLLNGREKAEIAASIISAVSILSDICYAVVKSVREIDPYNNIKPLSKAFDVARGGLKIFAGTLGSIAGGISAVLDFDSLYDEISKERSNWVLVGIYFSRGFASGSGAVLGFIAAFSYTGPLLLRLSGNGAVVALKLSPLLARGGTFAAEKLAIARTLWLLRVARINLVGLAVTVVEIIYRCWIKDDDLENWCQASVFRKQKKHTWLTGEKPYADTKSELEALENAFKAIKE